MILPLPTHLRCSFKKDGLQPVIVSNGKEALDAVLNSGVQWDAILLDVLMPVMNGDEALRIMRRRGVDIPVVVVTANALPAQRELYLSIGAQVSQGRVELGT
jgi:CheY-like chemotaxis protein